ncbi:hypothetical protein jhhlp_003943 [Lomentospora prolificans]|uniref:Granulins domain-containing protein n=1 Tax=Lomentospora prolificans TaxID=41688 RepID=A0A2N3NA67_9PEZI|nr:hypothetical protein jhhlp_003943 [Lomentospora prolificans]
MRTNAIKLVLAAASFGLAVEASVSRLASSNNIRLYRRQGQAFDPDETSAPGANCVEAFGPGYIECVPASATANRLCIIPSEGETCCDNKWGCPAASFCLVQDLCCPDGLDPQTCADQNNVDLPPDFVPGGSNSSSAPSATENSSAAVPSPTTSGKPTGAESATKTSLAPTSSVPVQINGAAREGFGAVVALAGLAAALV